MKNLLIILTIFVAFISNVANACTGMQIKTKDGNIINGRTVEFAAPITMNKVFVPRNYKFVSKLDDKTNGLTYKSKYAFIGGGMYNDVNVSDGVNEKGLSLGAFYFPGYAVYPDYKKQKSTANSLSPSQFTNWVLSQFATVDEVKQNINNITIVNAIPDGWSFSPPFHYVIYDKTGKSIVIEPLKDGLVAYDNPVGVLTNSPDFTWQMTNLKNYVGLSNLSAKSIIYDGVTVNPFGQGSGMFGLPGDFTPPSRFVRAVAFSKAAIPAPDLEHGITQMFHLLHQFDIPAGSVASIENGKTVYDYTMLTVVRDPQNLVMYFVTYNEPFKIQENRLSDYDVNGSKIIVAGPIEGIVPYFAK